MSLRAFLYATDAFMEDEGIRFATRLADDPVRPEPSPAENRQKNSDAMAQFQAMMSGVQKKPRRS